MPQWKKIYAFTKYVYDENERVIDSEEALGNLIDPNFRDLKAIKLEDAIRKFAKKKENQYEQVEAVGIYESARSLGYVERRDTSNSTHVTGVALVVTDAGKNFLHRSRTLKLKTGMWHGIAQYFMQWQAALSLFATVVSIAGVIVAIIALNKPD